jgi:hypothetical protein
MVGSVVVPTTIAAASFGPVRVESLLITLKYTEPSG